MITIILVLAILVGAVVLFVMERFSIDLVALMVLGVLVVFRLVTPEEAVSGLSSPATTVACMFVLSVGLQRTGAVKVAGRVIMRYGKSPTALLVLTMVIVGASSAFINNTGVVAVMLPMVLAAAAAGKLAPSKLLIPMSFASQAGGVCTLIGTSTNLLVSSIAEKSPYVAEPFSMFELGLGLDHVRSVHRLFSPFRALAVAESPRRGIHQELRTWKIPHRAAGDEGVPPDR